MGINFVKQLKSVAPQHKYLAVVPRNAGYEDIELPPGSKRYIVTVGESSFERWRFEKYILPGIVRDFEPDVVFGIANLGLVNPPCKQAILFHRPQLVYLPKHRMGFGWQRTLVEHVFKKRVFACLPKTQLVFCQTPVVRRRFSRTFKFPEDRIKIMLMGVSEFSKVSREHTTKPYIFNRKGCLTLFFLSRFYTYKNHEVLIDVFTNYRDSLDNVRCIITIEPSQRWKASGFLSKIKKYNLEKHIVNVGVLKQSEIAAYFYNSDVFFSPTLLESFGLPYLEAMYFGLPILTSDLDFARSVCDDAAIYFDPWKPADIVEKILMIKNSKSLREKLIEKGKRRVSSFSKSWEGTTAETIRELEALVSTD